MTDSAANGKTAVLLIGYGSPNGPEDIPGYLEDVLGGRTPSESMVAEYRRRYALIGGSPQNRILRSLTAKLHRRLESTPGGAPVYLATKHWTPNVAQVVPQLAAEGYRRVIAVPLSPYASTWILEPYRATLEAGRRAAGVPLDIDFRPGWHLNPHLIGYWAEAIRREGARADPATSCVLLSAHSLPQKYRDRGDPYPEILAETSSAIARAAQLERWAFTYQSAGNVTEPWLGPDITERMLEWKAKGARTQLVAAFGFIFEHLEVLYDLDVLIRQFAGEHGLDYRRVPMPNDADAIVEALADVATAPPLPPAAPRP